MDDRSQTLIYVIDLGSMSDADPPSRRSQEGRRSLRTEAGLVTPTGT